MFKQFQSMKAKVIVVFLTLTTVSIAGLSALSYVGARSIVMSHTQTAMQSVLAFRSSNLSRELENIRDQAASLAKIEAIQKSMVNLKSGWKTLDKKPGDARKELQKYFVTDNPNSADERSKLIKPEGPGGYYYSAHEELQPLVASLLKGSPFSDLLIADGKGNIFFSFRKDSTFAENVNDDPLKTSGLGQVYKVALDSVAKAQDDNIPVSFSGLVMNRNDKSSEIYVAAPLANLGALRGIMLFRVSDAAIARVLTMAIAPGSSERSVIVGSDGTVIGAGTDGKLTLLEPSAYAFKDAALGSKDMSQSAFARADGAATSFNLPMMDAGQQYLISESLLDSELNASANTIAGQLALFGVVVLAATSMIAWFALRAMFAPLTRLADATESVANGDLDTVIHGENRQDEMGIMSRALIRFRDSLTQQRQMEEAARAQNKASTAEEVRRRQEEQAQAAERDRVVAALGRGLNQLAEGNLAAEIVEPFPAELESLRRDFNDSAARLADAMVAIGQNSAAISSGSDEMRSSADKLASRTERQTEQISQAAAAIDAITRNVKAQMDRAEQATHKARGATDGTESSAMIMEQTIDAMQAIRSSSQQINTIITVIDEIAFQTNLLALNAGVEAARAGESGKGFAVVAQEVRELAQRSAKAAKEISDLLGKSTGEVETGVGLVERAAASLKAIGDEVRIIGSDIEAMMYATRQDAETLGDINASISQIEKMTLENAAMVEETTAAIHHLAREATEMDNRIGQFQLDEQVSQEWRKAG